MLKLTLLIILSYYNIYHKICSNLIVWTYNFEVNRRTNLTVEFTDYNNLDLNKKNYLRIKKKSYLNY